MTDRERFERLQHLLRGVFERLDRLRVEGDADEWWWSELRAALVAVGATTTEITDVAAHFIT